MRSLKIPLVYASLLGLCSSVLADPKPSEVFPLKKGNYWIYRGETKFLVPKEHATEQEKQEGIANEERSEVLTWKMEVIDTLERPKCFVALIKGAPFDLSWYAPGNARGDHLIVRRGASYVRYSGEDVPKIWEKLKASRASKPLPSSLQKWLNENGGEPLLEFPLTEGKKFGGDATSLETGRYCWVVDLARPLDSSRFPGAERFPKSTEYTLSYRAAPEHMFLAFATDVGIVAYTYKHHGTLAETELELIEFGRETQK